MVAGLVGAYKMKIVSPPCDPGSDLWSAFATLEADIGEVLPYLNAVWPDAIYRHTARVLTRRSGRHAVAIRPHEVAVSNVLDRKDAERLVDKVIAEINDVWARHAEIMPQIDRRQRPTAMDLYKLLPRTNCRACRQPTCWAFALQLAAGSAILAACAALRAPEHLGASDRLRQLLGADTQPANHEERQSPVAGEVGGEAA